MIKDNIKLSAEFKSQTQKAILSLVFFAFAYLILLALAVGLTILSIYLGIQIIIAAPRLITIILGVGLGSLGILILIFLLKFIFKSNKTDRSHLVEITKADEPELFKLIDEIVTEVGTHFPKKVYLSADVNAAVFYNSGFWSMFFPVKKNLQIGIGLVNTITKEELKAILSHEFGHFSQRTMKVGSYVYNVNKVIFNMLYDNDSYDKLIQGWANVSGYIAIFAVFAVKIVQGIQWILQRLYEIVNKSYLALSREMEFHADEIAANVTGYEPLKESLLRMSLADSSFNSVFSFYADRISENVKSSNFYKEQTFVMNHLAKTNEIIITNNLPNVTFDELNKFNKSKLVIKDQWASHPSTEERIERLELTNIKSKETSRQSARDIFTNIENIEVTLTNKLFSTIEYQQETRNLTFDSFKELFLKEFEDNTFAKKYNSYYDSKNPFVFDISTIKEDNTLNFDQLFSDENVDLVYSNIALENDIEVLKQIENKTLPIKTLDYDGKKYKRKEVAGLLQKLNKELEENKLLIKQNDQQIFAFFRNQEVLKNNGISLSKLYKDLFEFDTAFEAKNKVLIELSEQLEFLGVVTPHDEIRRNFLRLRGPETTLKKELQAMLDDSNYTSEITEEMRKDIDNYLIKDWDYFRKDSYIDSNLEVLIKATNHYSYLLFRGYFLLKKKLLDYQLELLK